MSRIECKWEKSFVLPHLHSAHMKYGVWTWPQWNDSKVSPFPSSLREMFHSLWPRPKKIALNSKSRICRIFEKEDNLVGVYIISWKFPFHSIFIPESPERSVERFASRNFNNFQIFWKFSPEISVPWFRKFRSNGKPPRTTLWGDLNFRKFLTGIIVSIKLHFLLSGILVWMVHFADFVFLPDFLENAYRKFPYHLSPFLNFRNLRLDENSPSTWNP